MSRALRLIVLAGLLAACSANAGGSEGYGLSDARPGPGRDGGRPDGSAADAAQNPGKDAGTGDPRDGGTGLDVPPLDTGVPPTGGDGGTPMTGDGGARACAATEVCTDGLDNNCDGAVDEGCACIPGTTQRCYDGPPAQAGVGVCVYGTQRCTGAGEFGTWSACEGAGRPQGVICGRMMDYRCTGTVDEGCGCAPGMTRPCYAGPAGTQGVGLCRAGAQTCELTPSGSDWGACAGQVLPAAMDLCDSVDRNCDGRVNVGCTCTAGMTRPCYTGPRGTQGVGACAAGRQTCVATSGGATDWGACTGQTLPSPDRCDGVDRDCDGNPNTGCRCVLGRTQACYTGPAGTMGVGVCAAGSQTCVAGPGGVGSAWSTACVGEVRPGAEVCANGRDDNCNGAVDEGCTTGCPGGAERCGSVCCATGQACVSGLCVGSGELRVTMTWDVRGDMDLHVVPPCGTLIYYANRNACGGELDRDSCPAQVPSTPDDPCVGPENIFWRAAPAAGTYIVCAVPYAIPSGRATNFTVTVNRGTTRIRTWSGSQTRSNSSARCSRSSPYFLGEFTI